MEADGQKASQLIGASSKEAPRVSFVVPSHNHAPFVTRALALPKNASRDTYPNALVKEPPAGDGWVHEFKFDGYRMLCRIDRGKVIFWSRNEKEFTAKFPNVVESVKSLPLTTAILDGETVMGDGKAMRVFRNSSAR